MQIYEIEMGNDPKVELTWHDKRQSDLNNYFPGDENFEHLVCPFWLKERLERELGELNGGISFANGLNCPTKDILKNGWPFHVFLRRVYGQKVKLVEGGIPSFGPEVPEGAIP
mgnify:CR=1 FL=1|tara:strand:- start:28011 stop:28349 length:339 start_codon:yes stop_codon:yes gene_type:complete